MLVTLGLPIAWLLDHHKGSPTWSATAEWVIALTALSGVIYAGLQLRSEENAHRIGRVIEFHRDLTTGEVGAARDRLTTLLWQDGESGLCARPASFQELLPPQGRLAGYTATVRGGDESEPMRDLFKVLWCFERIEGTRSGEALDEEMLVHLIGNHAMWWDELLKHVADKDVRSRYAVRRLAAWVETQDAELRAWAKRDFQAE